MFLFKKNSLFKKGNKNEQASKTLVSKLRVSISHLTEMKEGGTLNSDLKWNHLDR